MLNKKILFLTGTRADFGKVSPLIKKLNNINGYDYHIFVTGMHLLKVYGYTYIEVENEFPGKLTKYKNQSEKGDLTLDLILAETIKGLNICVKNYKPDLIVIHGDRVEALAGAAVGSLNNILTAHIEGGEISGTIDELIRHSISKLAHIHFVSNKRAALRLEQMGELSSSIFIIGSPDIDIMLSNELPSLKEVKQHYEIDFTSYSLFCYHPVTTEIGNVGHYMFNIVKALKKMKENFIIIESNNDPGREIIDNELKKLRDSSCFKFFPSLRHKYYLTLLKNCNFIIGNSSSGVREAPIYAKPSINLGTRQNNRHNHPTIINASENFESILDARNSILNMKNMKPSYYFGHGNSADKFINSIVKRGFWLINIQKIFKDTLD